MVREYNNEAQASSDYYDNYERIYVVTPLSRNQFTTTINNIQEAAAAEDEKKFEMVSWPGNPKRTTATFYYCSLREFFLYFPDLTLPSLH